jgi:hypothetical protein
MENRAVMNRPLIAKMALLEAMTDQPHSEGCARRLAALRGHGDLSLSLC